MKCVHDIERQIRDIIIRPRIQHALMQDRRDWMQLCASLDVIGDAQLAIDAHSTTAFPDSAGSAYLIVFGLFQACFLQQDATTHLSEVLHVHLPADAGLSEVRNTRNDIIGHPTKRGSQNSRTAHAISRPSISQWRIDVISTTAATAQVALRHVDIRKKLELQRKGIEQHLGMILRELKNREQEHAMSFVHEKLADMFPATLSYHCEKIFEGTYRPSNIPLAAVNLQMVHDVVEKFRSALTNRGELPGNDFINYKFDELRNPFNRLRGFFSGNSPLNAEDAYAITFFLRAKVQELAELAREMDESYNALTSK
jgi:hypothetical protein